ncbi:hypothetical protein SLEP1_g30313 [Rubroshorea leprosula]|uniref:Uncharacterized protein n=1 Tax=Rubroshorea leprosula TaxID=152421 RepID=A0AAV5K868_9ROSI|nr:hypothetical protein SLEP1_g30313 [Rubroshorea leprosula]
MYLMGLKVKDIRIRIGGFFLLPSLVRFCSSSPLQLPKAPKLPTSILERKIDLLCSSAPVRELQLVVRISGHFSAREFPLHFPPAPPQTAAPVFAAKS